MDGGLKKNSDARVQKNRGKARDRSPLERKANRPLYLWDTTRRKRSYAQLAANDVLKKRQRRRWGSGEKKGTGHLTGSAEERTQRVWALEKRTAGNKACRGSSVEQQVRDFTLYM